ncbi:MAG: hypothetical protein M3384_02620 [Acidobacteriota bacterium]|nr:hypothetical protein [Acidobacteriota bacterium]
MRKLFRQKNRILRFAGVLLVLSLFTFHFSFFTVSAHRYHTSLTRMDYNEKEKLVEISVQLFTHDLVPALERKNGGKRIDLEKTPDVDKLILAYLNENFVFKNKNGEPQPLRWVGKEMEVDAVWIYVEISSPESPSGANLQNTILFESFPEQVNLVIIRFGGKKADLMFKVGDRFKEIRENQPKE